jgi:hypothetical protein
MQQLHAAQLYFLSYLLGMLRVHVYLLYSRYIQTGSAQDDSYASPMEVDTPAAAAADIDLLAYSSSNTALSELPLLSSIFGFPDLPAAQQQGNVGYYVGKLCAFVEAVEQQVTDG